MKITIVSENTVGTPFPRGLLGEHGLAFLIEGETRFFYDTGQGVAINNNLKMLGINPDIADKIIISHGHYDHVGGLMPVLEKRTQPVNVYLHPEAFREKLAVIEIGTERMELPIGFQYSKQAYEEKGASFEFVQGFSEISKGVFTLSDVDRPSTWKSFDARLKRKDDGEINDDPFNDDLSLLLETGSGPVVLLGCAHAGIVEILDDLSNKSGHKTFHAVIGGTHLGSAEEAYIERAIDALRKYEVKMVGPSHCTGPFATHMMMQAFPKEFVVASAGSVFNF